MGGHDEASPLSGGVRVFSIGSRMIEQRERLLGMTEEERRWRAQFLKDQIIASNEPRFVPELYKATNNIFMRMFKIPMNLVEKAVTPVLGESKASSFRYLAGRYFAMYVFTLCVMYYSKYQGNNWTKTGGWFCTQGKEMQVPGDLGYPTIVKKEKYEYADLGFSKSHFW